MSEYIIDVSDKPLSELNPVTGVIVRCRDCVHFHRNIFDDDEHPHWCSFHGTDYAEPSGFCKWGERKDMTLKPCPFCGSTTAPHVERYWDEKRECYLEHQLQVICNFNNNGCGASSGVRGSEVEAIAAWNRRRVIDGVSE